MKMQSHPLDNHSKKILLILAWLLIGSILFSRYSHITLLFPIILFSWVLLVVASWRIVTQQKMGNLLTLLLLTLALFLPLSYIYARYAIYEYNNALQEFVTHVTNGGDTKLEFTYATDICERYLQEADFTAEYKVIGGDSFGVEQDWIVEFGNGLKYFIAMVQVSPRHWEVCVRPVN